MHTERDVIPIFGASTLEQFNDSMGALDVPWSEELAAALKNAGA